jgi:hypothetical protein
MRVFPMLVSVTVRGSVSAPHSVIVRIFVRIFVRMLVHLFHYTPARVSGLVLTSSEVKKLYLQTLR